MLIAPFFLFASLLWGAYLQGALKQFLHPDPTNSSTHQVSVSSPQYNNTHPSETVGGNEGSDLKSVIALFGLLGVSVLPVGYAIGVITLRCLGLLATLGKWVKVLKFPQGLYDVPFSDDAMIKAKTRIGILADYKKDSKLCIAAVFDHALLAPPIHQWLFRRWTTFNICAQCVTALLMSLVIGWTLCVPRTWGREGTIIGMIVVLGWQSWQSWHETHDMFDLVVHTEAAFRKQPNALSGQLME
jgi:hypothetical protein